MFRLLLTLILVFFKEPTIISAAGRQCNIPKYRDTTIPGCTCSPDQNDEINKLVLLKDFTDKKLQQKLLIDVLLPHTNIGYTEIKDKKIYRGSFLTYHPQCIKGLAEKSKRLNVINIYSGTSPIASDLSELERKQFKLFGVETYLFFQNFHTNAPEDEITNLIIFILRLDGDVYIHCFGGVHRTGLLFGIMQKCLNQVTVEEVIDEYRCHAGYTSPKQAGSARKFDEDRIRNFNCSYLLK